MLIVNHLLQLVSYILRINRNKYPSPFIVPLQLMAQS